MRTMVRITLPVQTGNRAFNDGSLPRTIEAFMQQWKPEAAYFFPDHGKRSALFVVDLTDPSQIVQVAEQFFSAFEAEVTLTPVMNAQDLRAGMEKVMGRKP